MAKTTWLTLSPEVENEEDFFFLIDMFFQVVHKDGHPQWVQPIPQEFWQTLLEQGIRIHPDLEKLAREKGRCIICGGGIQKHTGADESSWEERCDTCNYIYAER